MTWDTTQHEWFGPGAVGGVGATHVLVGPSEQDVRELDAAVEHLNTDIFNAPDPPGRSFDPAPMAWRKFKVEWVSYRVRWTGWKQEHVDALSRSTQQAGFEFEQFVTQYNEFLRRFKADFQGQTDVDPVDRDAGAGVPDIPVKAILIVGGVLLLGYAAMTAAPLLRRRAAT